MENVVLSRYNQKKRHFQLNLLLLVIYFNGVKGKHAGDSRGTCFQMLTFPVESSIQDCI